MSLSKSKCWHSNNYLHFIKCAAPLGYYKSSTVVEHSPHNPNVRGSSFASALAFKLPKIAVTFLQKFLKQWQIEHTHKFKKYGQSTITMPWGVRVALATDRLLIASGRY